MKMMTIVPLFGLMGCLALAALTSKAPPLSAISRVCVDDISLKKVLLRQHPELIFSSQLDAQSYDDLYAVEYALAVDFKDCLEITLDRAVGLWKVDPDCFPRSVLKRVTQLFIDNKDHSQHALDKPLMRFLMQPHQPYGQSAKTCETPAIEPGFTTDLIMELALQGFTNREGLVRDLKVFLTTHLTPSSLGYSLLMLPFFPLSSDFRLWRIRAMALTMLTYYPGVDFGQALSFLRTCPAEHFRWIWPLFTTSSTSDRNEMILKVSRRLSADGSSPIRSWLTPHIVGATKNVDTRVTDNPSDSLTQTPFLVDEPNAFVGTMLVQPDMALRIAQALHAVHTTPSCVTNEQRAIAANAHFLLNSSRRVSAALCFVAIRFVHHHLPDFLACHIARLLVMSFSSLFPFPAFTEYSLATSPSSVALNSVLASVNIDASVVSRRQKELLAFVSHLGLVASTSSSTSTPDLLHFYPLSLSRFTYSLDLAHYLVLTDTFNHHIALFLTALANSGSSSSSVSSPAAMMTLSVCGSGFFQPLVDVLVGDSTGVQVFSPIEEEEADIKVGILGDTRFEQRIHFLAPQRGQRCLILMGLDSLGDNMPLARWLVTLSDADLVSYLTTHQADAIVLRHGQSTDPPHVPFKLPSILLLDF
jgi:hypothetical protein